MKPIPVIEKFDRTASLYLSKKWKNFRSLKEAEIFLLEHKKEQLNLYLSPERRAYGGYIMDRSQKSNKRFEEEIQENILFSINYLFLCLYCSVLHNERINRKRSILCECGNKRKPADGEKTSSPVLSKNIPINCESSSFNYGIGSKTAKGPDLTSISGTKTGK